MKISVSCKLIKGKEQKSIQRKRTEGFQWYLGNSRFATGIFVIYLFYFMSCSQERTVKLNIYSYFLNEVITNHAFQ